MDVGQSFEWTFVVLNLDGPDDERVDALCEATDAVVESHGGLHLIAVLTEGPTAVDAARRAIAQLRSCDLQATRTYPDFVTRADIAERSNKRRQAVDNWVRGDRQKDFPGPVHLVGGGIWLWHDVQAWMRRERIQDVPPDDALYPSLSDHAAIDDELRHPGKAWIAMAPKVSIATVQADIVGRVFSSVDDRIFHAKYVTASYGKSGYGKAGSIVVIRENEPSTTGLIGSR